jgi:hypothetical protein
MVEHRPATARTFVSNRKLVHSDEKSRDCHDRWFFDFFLSVLEFGYHVFVVFSSTSRL